MCDLSVEKAFDQDDERLAINGYRKNSKRRARQFHEI
jgi:hypothetical protein